MPSPAVRSRRSALAMELSSSGIQPEEIFRLRISISPAASCRPKTSSACLRSVGKTTVFPNFSQLNVPEGMMMPGQSCFCPFERTNISFAPALFFPLTGRMPSARISASRRMICPAYSSAWSGSRANVQRLVSGAVLRMRKDFSFFSAQAGSFQSGFFAGVCCGAPQTEQRKLSAAIVRIFFMLNPCQLRVSIR